MDEPPAAAAGAPAGRPLEGVRVLDFTRVLSGPHATRMMADLGADVVKVEPPAGDLTRFSNPRVGSLATYFIQQNVGKRNISLDLSREEAVGLLHRLAERCDVLVENFRPGVMERMGLGYAALTADNPRLVYASISGYGATGPWVHRRAYAPVVGAETGVTRMQGDARGHGGGGRGHYSNDPLSHADVYASLECITAVLAALYMRERTGRGQHIDVSMAQTMLYVNEHVHDQLFDGDVPPDWIRSFQPGDYPVLTVADGTTVVISGHPAERGTFDRFVAAIGRPELADEPRFADVPTRLAHLDELLAELQASATTFASADELEASLAEQGLAMGVLRSVRELADSTWAAERGSIVEVSDRSGGHVRVPAAPWRFSEGLVGVRGEPKYRGEDNREVLSELLGLDETELDRLEEAGVLTSRVPPPPA
ncbi:MAG: CaiB/BaiF CoA-transferase family protein [Ilumatobacteraceae bacterium]|nr:MAG: CoA transferase [Actinomycetota bacterium]